MRRLWAVLLLGLVLVVVWVAFGREEQRAEGGYPASEEQHFVGEIDAVDIPNRPMPSGVVVPSDESTREAPPGEERPRLLAGRVTDTDGAPISGGRVSWLALAKQDREPNPAWPEGGWGRLARRSVEARTDADGRFAFPAAPEAAEPLGTVLLASAEGFQAGGIDLPLETLADPSAAEIVLEAARALDVRVIDARDEPVGGARVSHLTRPGMASPETPLFVRFLAEEARTDATGACSFGLFPGEQALWAETETTRSAPWIGRSPGSILLRLDGAFTLEGTVAFPNPEAWEPDYVGERRILVAANEGTAWRTLAVLREVSAGAWGPLAVPLGTARRFRVRLEGAPVVPHEVLLERPRAGDRLRIDLVGRKEAELWFYVTDADQHPIPDARATVWWDRGPGESGELVGAVRPDGFLYTGTFPPGHVDFRVSAPGFDTHVGYYEVPLGGAVPVTLNRGGRLVGTCTAAGKPVEDFEVLYWRQVDALELRRQAFWGRSDGRFAIDGLATGDWTIFATAPGLPSGTPAVGRVRLEQDAEVTLELAPGLPGGGRIIDAVSHEPLPEARVLVHATGGVQRGVPFEALRPVEADGTFLFPAFTPGLNVLRIECSGYSAIEVQRKLGLHEDFLEWDDLGLHRAQALHVQLRGWEDLDLSPGQLLAYTSSEPMLSPRRFDAEGRVVFEDVGPGTYRLLIERPDRSFARLQLQLDPGRDWSFEHQISGRHRVRVHVVDAHGEALSFVPHVLLACQEEDGTFVLREDVPEDGLYLFEGVRAERAQLLLFDPEQRDLGSREVLLGDEDPVEVVVRLGQAPFRVHVVDREGVPLAGARVRARSSEGTHFLDTDTTGGDGWSELRGIPEGGFLLDVSHGRHGLVLGVPVQGSEGEREVVLDANGALELVCLDGEEPLSGVGAQIESTGGVRLGDAATSDASGVVRFEGLGEGRYRIGLGRQDCWPTAVEVGLGEDERARREVAVRRLADAEVSVWRQGALVSGVFVSMSAIELGEDVAAWIADGRARAPGGLVTGTLGTFRLEGVPRGRYAWEIALGETSWSGTFELRPGARNEIDLVLGD